MTQHLEISTKISFLRGCRNGKKKHEILKISNKLNTIKVIIKNTLSIILIFVFVIASFFNDRQVDLLTVILFICGFLLIVLFTNRLDIILADKGELNINSEKIEINYRSGKQVFIPLINIKNIKIDFDGYNRKIYLFIEVEKTYKFQMIDKWYINVFGKKYIRINFNHFMDTFLNVPQLVDKIDREKIDRVNDYLN